MGVTALFYLIRLDLGRSECQINRFEPKQQRVPLVKAHGSAALLFERGMLYKVHQLKNGRKEI